MFRAMSCLLAVLIYLCVQISKKGCQCSSSIERKRYMYYFSNSFSLFQLKITQKYVSKKSCPWSKKNLVKLSYSAQKLLLRAGMWKSPPCPPSNMPGEAQALHCFFVFFFKPVCCKCLTALLKLTETRLKDSRYI